MRKENKIKLDALMLKFATIGEEQNSIAFQKEWQPFYQKLTDSEKKVAIKAWFDTILATAKAVRKDVEYVVKNGTDEEVEICRNFVEGLREHPFFDKNKVAA